MLSIEKMKESMKNAKEHRYIKNTISMATTTQTVVSNAAKTTYNGTKYFINDIAIPGAKNGYDLLKKSYHVTKDTLTSAAAITGTGIKKTYNGTQYLIHDIAIPGVKHGYGLVKKS